MVQIHPTAVVSARAQLGVHVSIGPFCVIDEHAVVGDRCRLASHVCVHRDTHLGADNQVGESAVLGGLPQHLRASEDVGGVRIGAGNLIREFVTVHRALSRGSLTIVGDNNMFMAGSHVAHDCIVGNRTILVNQVLLAGHVTVADRAYLSGAVAVHQFCRIGRNAMVGGQSHITRDVPPFVTVDGESSRVVGLNVIGMRRAGFTTEDLRQLKEAYRIIYRSGRSWSEILQTLKQTFERGPASEFYDFLVATERGIVTERRHGPNTLRITDENSDLDRLAG